MRRLATLGGAGGGSSAGTRHAQPLMQHPVRTPAAEALPQIAVDPVYMPDPIEVPLGPEVAPGPVYQPILIDEGGLWWDGGSAPGPDGGVVAVDEPFWDGAASPEAAPDANSTEPEPPVVVHCTTKWWVFWMSPCGGAVNGTVATGGGKGGWHCPPGASEFQLQRWHLLEQMHSSSRCTQTPNAVQLLTARAVCKHVMPTPMPLETDGELPVDVAYNYATGEGVGGHRALRTLGYWSEMLRALLARPPRRVLRLGQGRQGGQQHQAQGAAVAALQPLRRHHLPDRHHVRGEEGRRGVQARAVQPLRRHTLHHRHQVRGEEGRRDVQAPQGHLQRQEVRQAQDVQGQGAAGWS